MASCCGLFWGVGVLCRFPSSPLSLQYLLYWLLADFLWDASAFGNTDGLFGPNPSPASGKAHSLQLELDLDLPLVLLTTEKTFALMAIGKKSPKNHLSVYLQLTSWRESRGLSKCHPLRLTRLSCVQNTPLASRRRFVTSRTRTGWNSLPVEVRGQKRNYFHSYMKWFLW